MTEAEWLACDDPEPMLDALLRGELRGQISERLFRLFAVACCRRVSNLVEEPLPGLLDLGERAADGEAGDEELLAAAEWEGADGDNYARAVHLSAGLEVEASLRDV